MVDPGWGTETMKRYTLLLSKDIPRFLGCRIITKTPAFGILSEGRLKAEYPLPLSRLATRKELTHWLSTQLISILVPGAIRDPGPNRIRLANNPVAPLPPSDRLPVPLALGILAERALEQFNDGSRTSRGTSDPCLPCHCYRECEES